MQGDRLGEPAGFLVRYGEVGERGQGVGVVGPELGNQGITEALEGAIASGNLPTFRYAPAR